MKKTCFKQAFPSIANVRSRVRAGMHPPELTAP